jgi:type IV pilus assembly protein PilO
MDIQELRDLDYREFGDWPAVVKGVVLFVVICALVGGWYYYDTQHQYVELSRVEKKEIGLKKEFERKQAKAANLDAYKLQLAEMQESFGAMLRQLPNKTEVAALLIDVSQTGLAAGLNFKLFQPQGEIPKDFYAVLPIKIKVTGSYHQFGEFISGLAALPRIVTLHDLNISKNKHGELELITTAKTYRYVEEAG